MATRKTDNQSDQYRCSYHLNNDQSEYYKCPDCKDIGILEPDEVDQFGNRYYRYEEYEAAQENR